MTEPGRKYDTGKPRITLLPIPAVLEVVAVLEYGAAKYDADNWRKVRPRWRYVDAALRHIFARIMGEVRDPESGLSHWAHAATCLLFLCTYDLEGVEVPRTFEATSLPEPEPEPLHPLEEYAARPDRVDALTRQLATMFRPLARPEPEKAPERPPRPAVEPRECDKCGRNLGAFHPLDVCFDCRRPLDTLPPKGEQMPCYTPATGWADSSD